MRWHVMTSVPDVDAQAVPPQWPPAAQSLVIEDGVYEVCPIPMTSIALVTSRTLKVITVNGLV
jgi:antiviral helicase SKI2